MGISASDLQIRIRGFSSVTLNVSICMENIDTAVVPTMRQIRVVRRCIVTIFHYILPPFLIRPQRSAIAWIHQYKQFRGILWPIQICKGDVIFCCLTCSCPSDTPDTGRITVCTVAVDYRPVSGMIFIGFAWICQRRTEENLIRDIVQLKHHGSPCTLLCRIGWDEIVAVIGEISVISIAVTCECKPELFQISLTGSGTSPFSCTG